MKQKNKGQKNFIENFNDFKGKAQINLELKHNSITGQAILNNFGAKYIKFSIPLFFKKATFNFDEDIISMKEEGLAGKEKLTTDLYADNIFNSKRKTIGSLNSIVGNEFISAYIPNTKITQKRQI